jgi:formate transporter
MVEIERISLEIQFLGYLTDLFVEEPWYSGVTALAVTKDTYSVQAVFLRAVGANWLVCMAVFISIAAEDITGKIIGCYLPVTTFAIIGFEHTVANMFYVPLGLMYGANTSFWAYLVRNLFLTTLGNIVGGALFMGTSVWYLYATGGTDTNRSARSSKPDTTDPPEFNDSSFRLQFTCVDFQD